ncbi:HIRAN domain-containing protein [Pleionea sp. CnH1-48]|uniref:HIRAN domain-containing protein n=1 Tax=Pleionea sp. CnH1-48 TaxID=2954494 RepID=UPI00209767E8|nr:HIRAN domain-containing protein [Pleionea sp. CnH1-48]MCO7225764.1 HIRAN domain-containing protein [Pleionea sp. CnH1-48]
MSNNQYFKPPIPKGYRIFYSEIDVSGVGFRKKAIHKTFSSSNPEFYLESEPHNKHDDNAIKVMALKKGWFRTKKFHIGYVPKEVAKEIADKDLFDKLLPRIRNLWLGDRGGVKIYMDILGLKENYTKLKGN